MILNITIATAEHATARIWWWQVIMFADCLIIAGDVCRALIRYFYKVFVELVT